MHIVSIVPRHFRLFPLLCFDFSIVPRHFGTRQCCGCRPLGGHLHRIETGSATSDLFSSSKCKGAPLISARIHKQVARKRCFQTRCFQTRCFQTRCRQPCRHESGCAVLAVRPFTAEGGGGSGSNTPPTCEADDRGDARRRFH